MVYNEVTNTIDASTDVVEAISVALAEHLVLLPSHIERLCERRASPLHIGAWDKVQMDWWILHTLGYRWKVCLSALFGILWCYASGVVVN
jgi:hypothetical protein